MECFAAQCLANLKIPYKKTSASGNLHKSQRRFSSHPRMLRDWFVCLPRGLLNKLWKDLHESVYWRRGLAQDKPLELIWIHEFVEGPFKGNFGDTVWSSWENKLTQIHLLFWIRRGNLQHSSSFLLWRLKEHLEYEIRLTYSQKLMEKMLN